MLQGEAGELTLQDWHIFKLPVNTDQELLTFLHETVKVVHLQEKKFSLQIHQNQTSLSNTIFY